MSRGLPEPPATARALPGVRTARAVVLVEGPSDQVALETLAARRGRDLEAEHVAVVPTGGVHAVGRFLRRFGPRGAALRLAGLCDEGEVAVVCGALENAGFGADLSVGEMERFGFFVCATDLEHELVRSLGSDTVTEVIAAQGELGAFQTFQKQPAKRELGLEEQLWRFMWNRKIRYAPLLVGALELDRVPRALDGVLAHVRAGSSDGLVVGARRDEAERENWHTFVSLLARFRHPLLP